MSALAFRHGRSHSSRPSIDRAVASARSIPIITRGVVNISVAATSGPGTTRPGRRRCPAELAPSLTATWRNGGGDHCGWARWAGPHRGGVAALHPLIGVATAATGDDRCNAYPEAAWHRDHHGAHDPLQAGPEPPVKLRATDGTGGAGIRNPLRSRPDVGDGADPAHHEASCPDDQAMPARRHSPGSERPRSSSVVPYMGTTATS